MAKKKYSDSDFNDYFNSFSKKNKGGRKRKSNKTSLDRFINYFWILPCTFNLYHKWTTIT